MAILALLARAGDRGMLRDKMVALLWPDADDDRASRTLAQALYALRKDLVAEDAIVGARELRFDPALVASDVGEFASAVARGDDARAVELYAGPFLDGFHLSGADELTRWMERERASLAQDHARALESLARSALSTGNAAASVGWWRRLAALEPLNARVTVGLMEALAASGDRPGAIRHARVYELLVEQELDLPPDKEVTALAERLRTRADEAPRSAEPAVTAAPAGLEIIPRAEPDHVADAVAQPVPGEREAREDVPAETSTSAHGDARVAPRRRFGSRSRVAVAVAASAAALWLGSTRGRRSLLGWWPNDSPAVVAVGRIVSYGTDSSTTALAGPIADLLSTSLARSPGLRVISAGRMLELMRRTGAAGDTSGADFVTAARDAGATEIVDGTLFARPGGTLRLDLRRVDLATGSIANVNSIEGSDFFTLVDSGTARLVAAHANATPPAPMARVTTRSAAAYSLYVEGIQTLAQGDPVAAERLFAAALREDSTFAMAAYYYARTTSNRVPLRRRLSRALRLSANATERERLLIRAGWAWLSTAPELGPVADSLVRLHPQETEAHFYAGVARSQDGEFMAAIGPLRQVVAMDSLSFTRADSVAGCIACTAMSQIVTAYMAADSLGAAAREARRWTRLQPNRPAPWLALWDALERSGQFDEADRVIERVNALDPDAVAAMSRASTHALRTGRLTEGERIVRAALQAGNSAAQREALWQLVLSLRYQGRMREAMEAARRYRELATPFDSALSGSVSTSAAPLAVAMYEAGRYRESAALNDSMSRWHAVDEAPSGSAREQAWRLTHEARALAAAGDTAAVAALAGTIARVGARSGHVRDRRLDRYVRGLALQARNDLVGAEAAFRSAIYSTTAGYTRVNCELAAVLLRLGRPREAVAVLQPALRGKVDASNYYVTHTEVHELLAQAWDAAGRRDSAAVHYAWVARAWEHGDAPYAERAASARRHLAPGARP